MMMWLKIVCLINFSVIVSAREGCLKMIKRESLTDRIVEKNVIAVRINSTLVDCLRSCQKSGVCLSFFYQETTQTCQLHNDVFDAVEPFVYSGDTVYYSYDDDYCRTGRCKEMESCMTRDGSCKNGTCTGFRQYSVALPKAPCSNGKHGEFCSDSIDCTTLNAECVKGKCLCMRDYTYNHTSEVCSAAVYGARCLSDIECDGANMVCRYGVCACVAGYAMNPGNRSCLASCDRYGDTFYTIRGYFILDNNEDALTGTTIQECTDTCLNATTYVCRTFDFRSDSNACQVQSLSLADLDASLWVADPDSIHHERNCA